MAGKSKALETTIASLTKRYGEGTVMKMGDATELHIDSIPTGALSLDLALGIGGVPRGRVIEIYGPESSGKTTLCQHIIAEAQKRGGICAFIDVEHALDPKYAERCGVNVDALYVSQPDTGEQALEIAEALVRSGAIDVLVVDSVAALVPRAEIEGEMGDSHVGLQARLMSQALRKLSGAIKHSNTVMIFTNQLRQKIGVMFGNPETTSGGMALKFYASVRMDIRKIETLKSGNDMVGSRTRVTIKKNKVAPPFRVAEFDIMYNEGISREGDALDLGVSMGLVDKRGSYFAYSDMRLGQGRENAKLFLREHPELMAQMEGEIRRKAGIGVHNFEPTDTPAVVPFHTGGAASDELEDEDYAAAA
ncbi:MAG: recombinase RecA [Anaerolineae bacterium]|jgi:recombination protein RecA|uniref:recombinase RecA n=1 Tax=Candidatus Amarolinea dominans TaxID=3140696 RepID=UPI001DB23E92|nr:recombinase RecA [Anaerolineae bacterium]MBK7200462.1 recombinase RecA [Anaerolineae bacterium]MBK9092730.1 recombinase RecA [Anaerolineae bacterium]MBK9230808.1 recombinase RecA [Anaerolineae bacterium]